MSPKYEMKYYICQETIPNFYFPTATQLYPTAELNVEVL